MRIKNIVKNFFYPKPTKVLGIELGFNAVRMVQLDISSKPMEVTDYAVVDLPPEIRGTAISSNTEAVADFIAEVISKHGFTVKDAVFAIGGRHAFVREISMPPMPEEEMRQAITWDSTQYVPYESDSYYVDFAMFGKLNQNGQQPVVLVASPKEIIDALVSVGERCGLNILRLDIDVLCHYRVMQGKYENFVLLDMGREATGLTIFQHGAPVAQRSLSTGMMHFAKIIAEKGDVSISQAVDMAKTENFLAGENADSSVSMALRAEVDELIKECRRTIDYYVLNRKEASFTDLVLVGVGSELMGIDAYMNEQLDVQVKSFDVLSEVNFDSRFEKNKVKANATNLIIPIGAAMAGGEDDD